MCLWHVERMHHVSKKIVGDNIQGELTPFSFTLTSSGEELRAAPPCVHTKFDPEGHPAS